VKINSKLKILFTLLFLWVFIHTLVITLDGFTDKNATADIAVILGNKVNEDGTLSKRLQKRLECGLGLFKNARVQRILVSGGFGKEGFYEAEKMKVFLIDNGVPDSLILIDNYGVNTLATVKNTLNINKKMHFKSIIVVSQFYHVTRTKMLFRKLGYQNVSSCCPKYLEWRDFYSTLREFLAFYVDLLFC
jgi:vancomycin permeability regulator SanA